MLLRKFFSVLKRYPFYEPITLAVLLSICMLTITVTLSWNYYQQHASDFIVQVLSELHGLVIELVVIGIVVVWINRQSEKKRAISHCRQQLEDLRTLTSEYAIFQLISSIKTLNRYHVHAMDLNGIVLKSAFLKGADLSGSLLNGAELNRCILIQANLRECLVTGASFEETDLYQGNLSGISANAASFLRCNLSMANLENARLIAVSFQESYLYGASFKNANLLGADFQDAILINVDFRGCRELTASLIQKARIVDHCLFDPEMDRIMNR